MEKLFLLKPNFVDSDADFNGHRFFCPPCAMMLGVLSYYPELQEKLEIIYVDYQRPRQQIIDLVGSDNQSCPVLILEGSPDVKDCVNIQKYKNSFFINDERDIAVYLSMKYKIGLPH